MIALILSLFSGLSLLTLLPVIIVILGTLKSVVDLMASIASIFASITAAISSVFVAAQPTFKSAFSILGDLMGIVWGWFKSFVSWLWDNIFVILHQPATALTVVMLMLTAGGVGELRGIEKSKGVREAAVLAAKHDAYAKGHAEGIKEATNKKYRPNR